LENDTQFAAKIVELESERERETPTHTPDIRHEQQQQQQQQSVGRFANCSVSLVAGLRTRPISSSSSSLSFFLSLPTFSLSLSHRYFEKLWFPLFSL
jgi:hypothetical protein